MHEDLNDVRTPIRIDWELLARPAVRQELKLPGSVVREIEAALASARNAVRQRQRRTIAAEAISFEAEVLRAARPELAAIGTRYKPAQRWRLQQLSLQGWGPYVWEEPGVESALKLTKPEKCRIAKGQARAFTVYQAEVRRFIRRRHPKMAMRKGGIKVPVRSPTMERLERLKDRMLWKALRSSLSSAQGASLLYLLRPPQEPAP